MDAVLELSGLPMYPDGKDDGKHDAKSGDEVEQAGMGHGGLFLCRFEHIR